MGKRDERIEKWLAELGVKFTFLEKVSPGSFDTKRSRENQARLGNPIDEEVRDRYAEDLKNGDEFPPVVAYRLSSGQLEVLDGNHRQAAHELTGQAMDVYQVDDATPPALRALITFQANAKHGKPSTTPERLHHAMFMVNNGKSVAKAAAAFGVPVHALQKLATQAYATRRAEDAGIPVKVWERIPTASQLKLNTISTDEGFIEAVKLTADADLNSTQVTEMVRQLNASKSAAKQKAEAEALRGEHEDKIQTNAVSTTRPQGQRKSATSTAKGRLSLAMGQLRSAWTLIKPEDMTPTMKDELAEALKEAKDELEILERRLKGELPDDGATPGLVSA